VADLGLVTCACEVVDREDRCQIDEGARDGGDWDAAPGRYVLGVDVTGAVCLEALDAPLRGSGDFRRRRRALENDEHVGSGQASKNRPFPTGPDRREVPGLDARRAVPDPIDAWILAKQGTRAKPLPDLGLGNARAQEPCAGHHAM